MKKLLGILVLSLLMGCSTTETIKVSLDEIPRIEKDDYIIIAFIGYGSGKRYEAEVHNLTKIEKIILDHCNKKDKRAYHTSHYKDSVEYSYGSGLTAKGQRFWCAKTKKAATKLYRNYLKNPPDQYLSANQIYFGKRSLYWLQNNQIHRIEDKLNEMVYKGKITEFSPESSMPKKIKKKEVKKKKKEPRKKKEEGEKAEERESDDAF